VAKCSAGLQTESLLKQGPEVDSGVHISVVRKKRGLGGSGDKFNDIVWLRRLRSMCGFAKDDLRFAETVSETGDEDIADRICQKTPKLTAPPETNTALSTAHKDMERGIGRAMKLSRIM
jgi:hypothetical protein